MLLWLRARELRRITTGRAPQRRESLDESQQGARPRDARASTNHSRVSHWRELPQHELPRSSARFLDPARGRSTDRADSVTISGAPKVASRYQFLMCFGDLGAYPTKSAPTMSATTRSAPHTATRSNQNIQFYNVTPSLLV